MVIVGDAEKLCTCSNLPPSAEAACTLAVCELRFWLLLSTSCCETESDLDQVANRRHSKLPDWGLNHISIENHDPILDVGCGEGRAVHKWPQLPARTRDYAFDRRNLIRVFPTQITLEL